MKIVILGSTGMLGSAVGKSFIQAHGEDAIHLSYRNEDVRYGKNTFCFDPLTSDLSEIPACDYVINCIGVIKPFMKNNIVSAIRINSLFPHLLADFCHAHHYRLIHITTDCVFSGKQGRYVETDAHDALDDYGKTKSLGEPSNCMVLRTSIIGEEMHKQASLVAWLQSQRGKSARGFTNHHWNGLTTKQYGAVCQTIIDQDKYQDKLYHIFSNSITKYELLQLLNKRFKLNVDITPVEDKESIDRTLASVFDFNEKLNIPDLTQQIMSM